jgi:hypothetical protein
MRMKSPAFSSAIVAAVKSVAKPGEGLAAIWFETRVALMLSLRVTLSWRLPSGSPLSAADAVML